MVKIISLRLLFSIKPAQYPAITLTQDCEAW